LDFVKKSFHARARFVASPPGKYDAVLAVLDLAEIDEIVKLSIPF
jgi:hypothetical protein